MAKKKKAPALEQNGIEILGFLDEGRSLAAPPEAEKPGMLRKLGDVGVAAGQGVVSGVKMLTDLAGAGNPVSGALDSANKGLDDLYSPARMAERAARAQAIKEAEASGSTWEEIKAHAGGILEAPVQSIANAAGTMAPTVASAFIPGVLPARLAAGTMGIAQGVGTVKGSIYDAVERKWLEAGAPPEIAKQKADEAQAYGGENTPAMIAGGALGLVAGRSGVEHAITSGVKRAGIGGTGALARGARGAIAEAIPEGAQGGQERLASNVAVQGQGFDVPTFQGVAGSAVSEAMASAPLGGAAAALRPEALPTVTPPDPGMAPGELNGVPPGSPAVQPAPVDVAGQVAARRSAAQEAVRAALDAGVYGADAGPMPPVPPAGPVQGPAFTQAIEPIPGPLARAAETAAGAQAGQNAAAAAAGVDPAQRLAELEQKATGTKDQKVTGPDGKPVTIPGTPAQFLTDAEKQERDSLKGSVSEAEVAARNPITPTSPAAMAAAGPPADPLPAMHQAAADNLADQKQFGGDRPGIPSTNAVVYQEPKPRDMPPAFEQPVTPGQIFESIDEIRERQRQEGEMLSGLVKKNEVVPFRGKPPAIDDKTIDGEGLYRVIGETTAETPDFADHTDLAGRAFAKNPRLTLEVLRDPNIDHQAEAIVLKAITRGGNATAQYAKLALEAFQARPKAGGAQQETGRPAGGMPEGQEVDAAQPEPLAGQESQAGSTQGTPASAGAAPAGEGVAAQPGAPEQPAGVAAPAKVESVTTPPVESVTTPPLTIEPVSDTTMVIRGSGKHKEAIKAAGGSWNGPQKGWIFPKAKEAQVREALGDLVGQGKEGVFAPTAPKPAPQADAPIAQSSPKGAPKVDQRAVDRAAYFTPGNVVASYGGGHDRVISYGKSTVDDGWSVTVESVVQQDGEWVKDPKDKGTRTHSTEPDARALKTGPVAAATPEAAPAPAAAPSSEPATPKAEPKKGPEVSKNVIVTDDEANAIRARMKARLNRLNSGVDPEMLLDGMRLGIYHIERGARTFAAYAKAMVDDLGDGIRPYLKSFYMGIKYDPRAAAFASEMDGEADIDKPAADKPTLDTPDGRNAIAQQVADHFIGGNAFATIIEARKFIADITGAKIEAATQAAKLADETIEVAVVLAGREMVAAARKQGRSDAVIYDRLVGLYNAQPNLSVRSSTSVREQAYSTPVPLAFLASRLAGIKPTDTVLEPTAGNGMLMIEVAPGKAVVNELNPDRAANLKAMGFEPTSKNAATFPLTDGQVDAQIMNPPFGAVKDADGQTIRYNVEPGYATGEVDHAIVFNALKSLKPDGRAVLIVGGVDASADEMVREGYRGRAKREFYFRLYQQFGVVDHFTVDGDLYSRQGAGYPVDVIVIRGRDKATRALPAAELPQRIDSWDKLKEKLNADYSVVPAEPGARTGGGDGATRPGDGTAVVDGAVRPGDRTGDQAPRPGSGDAAGSASPGSAGTGRPGAVGAGAGAAQPGAANGNDAGGDVGVGPVPGNGGAGKQPGAGGDAANRPADVGGDGRIDGDRVQSGLTDRRGKEQETENQVAYSPKSGAASVGTLVPVNMRDAIAASLARVSDQVGDIDQYVADALGFEKSEIGNYFSAEQSDALALAIYNAEKDRGFIIGDQTGIGKGRVVAGMIRYALNKGKTPIFVTEKPNLYADIIRDLDDIGMTEALSLESGKPAILITNNGESIPYQLLRKVDGEITESNFSLKSPKTGKAFADMLNGMVADGSLGPYKVVFTTYNQLQTVNGKATDRMNFVRHFSDGGYVIFDESHNAGGTVIEQARNKVQQAATKAGQTTTGRAGFVRGLVRQSAGSFFSSATYAKRPDVMDLYSSTNMLLAVNKPSELGPAIKAGGVPMQQIVATMLTEDGQYIRRERSFAGVGYETRAMTVDKQTAENMATSMRMVLAISRAKEGAVKRMQKELDKEGALMGVIDSDKAQVQSANFGSIMHNLIDQMLLALKVKESVSFAIERLKAGEKVVLTVSNTMGSFLKDYSEEMGLRSGEPVALSFRDLYLRYLEKQRIVKIKRPGGAIEEYRLTDQDLGPQLTASFEATRAFINEAGFGDAPISPIDFMHAELRKAGYKTDEITGRTMTVNYGEDGIASLASRQATIRQRLGAIQKFNSGAADVLILNQSGSTGLSLHASNKVKDQRQRRMIIVQAEKNIDVHMQMLGRVHRTGQVITPNYTQAMADIPAEMRPAAVLAKKMASLNANTTASRKSAVSAEGVVDFVNDYGGQVAVEFLLDNPDVHQAIGGTKVLALPNESTDATEDDIRKLTGYIPILPIEQQETVYRDLVERYNELIERENSLGTNKLEARALDLDAKTLTSEQATPVKAGADTGSRFAAPAFMEHVDVKRTVKPMTGEEVRPAIDADLDGKTPEQYAKDLLNKVRLEAAAYISLRRKSLADGGADALRVQAEEDKIRLQLSTVQTVLQTYRVGTPVTITDNNGIVTYGVITSILNTKKTKNPVAWSSWKMGFALANGEARTISLNFGQLGKQFTLSPETGRVMTTGDDGKAEYATVLELFDRGSTVRREKRWMVTGNILAGFAQFPGQIVSYTKADGTTAQGVMMRRGFDYAKRKEGAASAFGTPAQVLEFFEKTQRNATVSTPDLALRIIAMGYGDFDVVTPSSKREGGTYFLDRGLTGAMGGDFYKAGSVMRARISQDALARTLEHLMNGRDDITLTARTNQDVARKVLGLGAPAADAPPAAKFSRGTDRPVAARDGPLTPANARISAVVERIKATWPNAPEIIVIDSMADAPADVQANDASQRSGGAKGDPEGFYHDDGKVYLVAGALETDADVERVLAHEVLGHAGLRGAFGVKVLGDILEQLAAARPAAIRAKLDEYGLKNTPAMRMVAAEEVLAELAQTQPTLGFVRRAIAAIRTWLRQRGVGLRMSDDEVVRNYILPARRFVQGQRTGESAAGSPVPAFSREDDVFVNEVLAELSQHDDLFRYSESKKTTLDGVMAEVFSQAKYLGDDTRPDEREESGADVRHVFQTALGKNFYIYERGKEVWADISRLEEGEHGGGIYAAILNYTHNAKKVLIGDPAGLSEAAVIRRTSAMLSSALRFGTTAHMDAAAEQRAGDPAKGIAPLKWQGDDVQKTSALIETFLSTLYTQMPALKGYRYDFRTRKFLDRSGRPLGPDRFADASRLGISRSARVGEATARRGIFLQSLVSSEGSARPGLLEQVLRRGNSLAGGDLRGMFSRKKTVEQARETFADMMQSTKAFNWWNKSIGTQYQKAQQNTTFRAVYNRVQDYIQDISDFGSRAAAQAPTLLPRLDKLRDVLKKPVSAADQKAIAKALYAGTLAGESVIEGKLWTDAELREQFSLTDPQISLYREARAAIDQSIDDLGRTEIAKLVGDTVDPMFAQQAREASSMEDAAEALQAGLDEKIAEARQDESEDGQRKVAHLRSLRRAVRAQTKRIEQLKDAGYMPLMRFGKYAVNVADPDVEGESLHFALFDTEREANAHAREIAPQFPGKQITKGIISDRASQLMQGIDPATLEIFAEAIGASESEVFQEYLKLVTSQRSAMKRLIERKGTPGFSEDIKRSLAAFITSNARAASGNLHLRDLLLNTSKIKEGDVKDEAIGLVKHVLDPQPDPSAKARSLLFMQFIGGSVASALVNLTQPVTMTLPYLSQYSSPAKAANLLRKATLSAIRGVTGDEAAALKRAESDGIVSPQEIHFLYGEAEKAFGSNPLLQRAGFLWGAPFGLAEQFNRRATFIAAYRLGVERNEANPFAFAEKAVIETQGVYNRGNASNWARNPVGGALLTFKQFSVAYIELLKRLPNRERAIALAILALASGMEGLPGADDLDDILDTFAQAFGYNWSSKQAKREFITATLGPEMAQFTTRGVSAFLPMDVSARMGMGNLLPGTGLLMQSRQDKGREVAEVFGAPGGAVQMVGKAATQAMAGEPIGAVSAVLPVALQNLLDPNRGALALAASGQYKDERGRRVVDVDAVDALLKAAGFNPTTVSEPQMAMRIAKQSIDLARAVESEIAGDLAAARVESDSTRAESARARLADWNEKNPDTPIRIEESQIRRRAREMQTTKADRLTRTAPREMRAGIRSQVESVDE